MNSIYHNADSLSLWNYTSLDTLTNQLYSLRLVSSNVKSYLLDLASLYNYVIGNNDPIDSIYDVFANDAITYENEIVSDGSLSANEKTILLTTYATSRYSLQYWGNYLNIEVVAKKAKGHGFWNKVGGADAGGAVTGGLTAVTMRKNGFLGGLFGGVIASLAKGVELLISGQSS